MTDSKNDPASAPQVSRSMTDSTPTNGVPVASPRKLLRSTMIAAAVAATLLITVVLPAEHGIDPTGVGDLLGLTKMGEIKRSLAEEAAATPEADVADRSPPPVPRDAAASVELPVAIDMTLPTATPLSAVAAESTHVTEVVLAPNEGKEIKLVMSRGARVTYSWATDRGVVNYDTHADAPGIKYHGYGKGTGKQSDEGVLEAAFDGSHGWFWRNRGTESVTVTLRTHGEYRELKRL